VAVGVLVLIVVLAVMAGFEREIKSRILGFTPHIVLRYAPRGFEPGPAPWRELSEAMEKVDGVEEAYAFIQDNVIVDFNGLQANSSFRAIDTENEKQIAALEALLAEKYGGTADMGLGETAVIAETTANVYGLRVGDVMQLYSTRNFGPVLDAYKLTEEDPVHVKYAEPLAAMREDLKEAISVVAEKEQFSAEVFEGVYGGVVALFEENIRPGEKALLEEVWRLMETSEKDASGENRLLPAGSLAKMEASFDGLAALDMEREDAKVLKGIKEIVLPKDVEVIGVYKASQHVLHPALFVPLPTGQELRGLKDGVDGVALRVEDPYRAKQVAERVRAVASEDWMISTWGDQYKEWFDLIRRERVMMYFALSFIILVSAFCIGAVMFTVTIQKKQEIGVMKALGAVPMQIIQVFLYQGMVIGVFGGLLGVGLGLLVVHFREPIQRVLAWMGFDPFPAKFHGIASIPAHVNPIEVLCIATGAFILCSLAALLPALVAARSDPARSLRNF
jgi:lipoprotein-releasing system permease protein